MDDPLFRLGIIGGCMSHQPGVPRSRLYHHQLATRLRTQMGLRVRVHIAREFDDEYSRRLDELLERTPLDGVLLHTRVTVVLRARLAPSHNGDSSRVSFLHPFLFRRRLFGWARLAAAGFPGCVRLVRRNLPPDPKTTGIPFGEAGHDNGIFTLMNCALGALVGLDRWAIDDELHAIKQFVQHCASRRVPVAILGPSPRTANYWDARTVARANRSLKVALPGLHVPFTLCDDTSHRDGENILLSDGVHLSPAGHTYIADRSVTMFEQWLPDVLHRTRPIKCGMT